ncbi:hypothetical protein GS18_0212595 [Metabacillus indicus]|uniref:Uncharacterized protein n=1 Tax=Metabacillus indicus TaxID=246786 RepID=A0A084GX72_METID|nr:hypothetical protein GS18_0212595 [Metabacillus indicus]
MLRILSVIYERSEQQVLFAVNKGGTATVNSSLFGRVFYFVQKNQESSEIKGGINDAGAIKTASA